MKSNICKIEKGAQDLSAILKESEKTAVYNELNRKQALHMRLLCEEVDGMISGLIGGFFSGDFWIDFEDGVCKINLALEIEELSSDNKNQLIKVAKNKKNSAVVGIVSRIRAAIENALLDIDFTGVYAVPSYGIEAPTSQYTDMVYSQYWSLNQYRNQVKKDNKEDSWDELEKSVVASIADDIIVGIKGKRADIIIIKKFA